MKKILGFAFAFMMLGLFSCSSTKFRTQKTVLELTGNPTTGYSWYYEFEKADDSVVSIEEKVTYKGAKGVVGAPSLFQYTIHSVKPGAITVKFEYKRIWENVEPLETRVYSITVNENGKVNVTEIENQNGN